MTDFYYFSISTESVSIGEDIFFKCDELNSIYVSNEFNKTEIFGKNVTSDDIYRGSCGLECEWILFGNELEIFGVGNMDTYEMNDIPWIEYKNSIEQVVIGKGITTISRYAFYNFTQLKYITISCRVSLYI